MDGGRRVHIRPRVDADLHALFGVLAAVYESGDGYPVRAASVHRGFLTPDTSLGQWVAEIDGSPVGQVTLAPGAGYPTIVRAVGRPADELAVVGRLFVAPWARRAGAGQALLDVASSKARRLGLRPVLDVVEGTGAVRLYERLGWTLVDIQPAGWLADDGSRPTLRTYAAPPSRLPAERRTDRP